MSDVYPFAGQPLTPAIIERLIIELFAGQLVERHAIVQPIREAHMSRGGSAPRAQDFARSVKTALADMRSRGMASNPSFGYWRIGAGEGEGAVANGCVAPRNGLDELESPWSITISVDAQSDRTSGVERVIGDGPGAVYVYYLPAYRQLADSRNEDLWPCKVGRTARDPLTRVLAQSATALPERPVIALLVRTHEPQALESAIHSILIVRGRRIMGSPGAEWFLTSPAEIEEITQFIASAPDRPDPEPEMPGHEG